MLGCGRAAIVFWRRKCLARDHAAPLRGPQPSMYYPKSSGSGGSSSSKPAEKKDDHNITGKFDPTALERGAAALKELGQSPNAQKAFELTKMQELTKQKEVQAEIEQQQTMRAQAQMQRSQIEAEEKRKTISHQSEQERRTAEYKARLDNELYQNKLEDQQKQIDQQLQMQHEQFMREEEIRKRNNLNLEQEKRRTMEEQAKLDRETAVARAKAEAQGRAEAERENVEVRLREIRARMAETRKTSLDQIQAVFSGLGTGSKALLEDRTIMATLVGGLTALAVGVYGARAATRVAGNLLERELMRPPLVRETSRLTWNKETFSRLQWWNMRSYNMMQNIVP